MKDKVTVQINKLGLPLRSEEVDEIFGIIRADTALKDKNPFKKQLADSLVQFFGVPDTDVTHQMLVRYSKMTPQNLYIPFTLAEPKRIEEQIVSPLFSAKRLACVGEFLASVALSGMVGEMMAVFIWDLYANDRRGRGGKPIKDKDFFRLGFSKIFQGTRINILLAFNYITKEQYNRFQELSGRRNHILHPWIAPLGEEKLENTAVKCYCIAANLMKEVFGIQLADAGTLKISPHVMSYIKQHRR